MRLNKLETVRRQLETAISLYFEHGDEVSIHTLAAAAYSVIRDVNEHRGGEPMIKDFHLFLSDELARAFKRYINRPENFLKHADKDPEGMAEFEPRWTEVLIYEASKKYLEITGENNNLTFMHTFILWFTLREPALREAAEKTGILERFTRLPSLPINDRKRFFSLLK